MTSTEFLQRDQLEAAKIEFERLWREKTAEYSLSTYQLGASAYLTARLLAWKIFIAGKGLK